MLREMGDQFGLAVTLGVLGEVALAEGDAAGAAAAYGEQLDLALAIGERWNVADAFAGFAGVANLGATAGAGGPPSGGGRCAV